jgi:PepSY-associated TM region
LGLHGPDSYRGTTCLENTTHEHCRGELTVSWTSNFARIHWDLHSALGFWSFPFIFLWAISGFYFAFPDLFNAVFSSDSLGLLWLADLHFGRFNWATKSDLEYCRLGASRSRIHRRFRLLPKSDLPQTLEPEYLNGLLYLRRWQP